MIIRGGEMGALVRAFDWTATALGPLAGWPGALRMAVNQMLNSPESMYLVWGPDQTFLFNDAYRPILGPRLQHALGQPLARLWPDAIEIVRPALERALAGQASRFEDLPIAMSRHGAPEETFWSFSYAPIFDERGHIPGVICYANETTARIRRSQHLAAENLGLAEQLVAGQRESERLWAISRDLFLVVSREGYYNRVNPAWQETLGYREHELLGLRFDALVHPDDREMVTARFRELLARQSAVAVDVRMRHADGSYRQTVWTAEATEEGFYCSGRDVTTQLLAEEQLRQSQKMEAVGQLTGGVAHDFNNLLTIIRSSVDLLRRPDLPDERRRRYLEAVSDTVDRAAKLTGQLLAFARRQALKPEEFDVGARVRSVADMLDTVTGARVRVTTDVPTVPCFVHADPNQFETALVNMAVNARDAMDGEGSLRLAVERHPMPPIRGHAGAAGSFVAVSLMDTGGGIPAEQLNRIFEPFFTTKGIGKGTGLGLSQVFGFAKQSGGDIDVASRPGEGTTFTLYLPEVAMTKSERVGEQPDRDVPAPAGSGQRVLVVEDNVEVGRFATQILEDLGYATELAVNAEAALERLDPDGAGFDVVFSDVVMPGMGGIELAKVLHRRLPSLPVVLASGYSHVLAQEGVGEFTLLHKPYSAEQLARVLRDKIAKSGLAQAGSGAPTRH